MQEIVMIRTLRALILLITLAPLPASAADNSMLVELNSIESVENRCRLNFVIENKSQAGIESLRLDLVAFATDGGILRRLLTEMGPLRAAKTMVRAFVIDAECRQLGAILVNDVTSCAPDEPGVCLDRLALSSRIASIRLYK
jgi:hypothetical protein